MCLGVNTLLLRFETQAVNTAYRACQPKAQERNAFALHVMLKVAWPEWNLIYS